MVLWAFMRTWEDISVGLPWPLQTSFPVTPHTSCQCSVQSWLLWVVSHPWLIFLVGRICWPTLTANIWKWVQSQTGRVPIDSSASPETMPAKGVLCRFWIFGSLLDDGIYCHAFEGQSIATGSCHVPVFVMPPPQESCRCRRFLRSSANMVGVWPVIVVFFKETGRETNGDSLVVKYILHF